MNVEITANQLKQLYLPPSDKFITVDVPDMRYVVIDGEGDPRDSAFPAAVKWLHATVDPVRREARERMGRAFAEPPLECLWWTEGGADTGPDSSAALRWRLMIVLPDWLEDDQLKTAITEAERQLGDAPHSLTVAPLSEGRCVQTMLVGEHHKARGVVEDLFNSYLPQQKLTPAGPFHEIYLTDPSKVAPQKQRTVLRQPVRPAA